MRFVADECVDGAIVARLRADEHEVAYVAEFGPGSGDEGVLETANDTGALLLTADKDFGDLVFRLGRVAGGVILVRLAGLPEREKADMVVAVVARHGDKLSPTTISSPIRCGRRQERLSEQRCSAGPPNGSKIRGICLKR